MYSLQALWPYPRNSHSTSISTVDKEATVNDTLCPGNTIESRSQLASTMSMPPSPFERHEVEHKPQRSLVQALISKLILTSSNLVQLNNRAVTLADQGNDTEARRALYRAMSVMERGLSPTTSSKGKSPMASQQLTLLELSSTSSDDSWSSGTCNNKGDSHTASRSVRPISEYDEGMDPFVTMRRCQNTEDALLTILWNLGRLELKRTGRSIRAQNSSVEISNFETALACFRRAFSISSDPFWQVSLLCSIGCVHYYEGELSLALDIYEQALEIARHASSNKIQSQRENIAACLNCIGVVYYTMGEDNLKNSLLAFREALQIQEKCLNNQDTRLGTTWNNIGRLYYLQVNYEAALEAYQNALMIRSNNNKESLDTAATIFNIGQVYHQTMEYSLSSQYYRDFLRLAKLHFGEYHRDVCIVTTCIGEVFQATKKYSKAINAFEHALRIGKKVFGESHGEIAIIRNKMGNFYYEIGDYDSALKSYHEGLEVERYCLDSGMTNIFITYSNIAEIYKQRSELDKAMFYNQELLKEQRQFYEKQESNLSNDDLVMAIASTLGSIALILHQKEEFEEALEMNQECIHLRREVKGDTHETVASAMQQASLNLLKMGRYNMALEAMLEAYRIRKAIAKDCEEDARELAFMLYNIGLIYHQQGLHDLSLRFYLETARIEKKLLGNSARDLSITLYNIGQIHYMKGEMDDALLRFREALVIEKKSFGTDHLTCARTLITIGNIELQRGNIQALMLAFSEALRIQHLNHRNFDDDMSKFVRLWRFDLVQPDAAAVA